MTIINQTYKFIFIHIPKNAGTSVTNLLSAHTYWQDIELGGTVYGEAVAPTYKKRFGIGKHSRAEVVRNVVGERIWDRYFKFAFVRNPYARTLSTYHFLKKWRAWPNSEIMDQFNCFESFVISAFFQTAPGPDAIFMSQSSWICDANGRSLLDHVCKVENINSDIMYVVAKIPLNIPQGVEIQKLNQSGVGDHKNEEFTDLCANVISQKYQDDFQNFGYDLTLNF